MAPPLDAGNFSARFHPTLTGMELLDVLMGGRPLVSHTPDQRRQIEAAAATTAADPQLGLRQRIAGAAAPMPLDPALMAALMELLTPTMSTHVRGRGVEKPSGKAYPAKDATR